MIMIEIVTQLYYWLLLVNPCILHQNNGPVISVITRKKDAFLPAFFNPLNSSTNLQLFKKNFCNQNSHYENYGRFLLQMEAIVCLPQNRHFLQ